MQRHIVMHLAFSSLLALVTHKLFKNFTEYKIESSLVQQKTDSSIETKRKKSSYFFYYKLKKGKQSRCLRFYKELEET